LANYYVRLEPGPAGGEDALIFTSGRREIRLAGKSFGEFLARVVPLLDGRRTLGEIQESIADVFSAADVERALAFARAWDGDAPMVVHCFAGVSRSSATALAIACERNPDTPEQEIALLLRRLAPHAFPNRRITAIADQLLGRRGRLIHAVEAMGRDDLEAPHVPVELPSRFPTIVVPP